LKGTKQGPNASRQVFNFRKSFRLILYDDWFHLLETRVAAMFDGCKWKNCAFSLANEDPHVALKIFLQPSHRIFGHIYKVLNIVEKKTNYTV
jgi:hypothetical protein